MQRLGRGVFYVWLTLFAVTLFVRAFVLAAIERVLGWSTGPFGERVGDRLFHKGAVVFPTVDLLQMNDFATPDDMDGPGWSEVQVPKLWHTCRSLAQTMGVPPPDALHLSLEPGDCCAWSTRTGGDGPLRRHIALSLLDLRLATHDEARAVIAHEIAHAGLSHSEQRFKKVKLEVLMEGAAEKLPLLPSLPMHLALAVFRLGLKRGAHDNEREADQKASEVVGGNHLASALRNLCLRAPVLERIFLHVMARAKEGPRAPIRLAEAAMTVYLANEFPRLRKRAVKEVYEAGPQHPAPADRVAEARREPSKAGIGGDRSFIDAYPELLIAEELLTKTYFPDTPTHTRSDASQLRRKALAARLQRR